jgi:hypothetical protein
MKNKTSNSILTLKSKVKIANEKSQTEFYIIRWLYIIIIWLYIITFILEQYRCTANDQVLKSGT